MSIVRLGDLQRAYRVKQRTNQRHALRRYLIDRGATSSSTCRLVSRSLYADGLIDNIGLTDMWIAGASEAERAGLFSDIATALLGDRSEDHSSNV
jgi:hypothetical protein